MAKSKITMDHLAVMIKKGFDGQDKKFAAISKDIGELKQGQEEIKLGLDNVAYRFELVALENRVKALEKHTGIKVGKGA